MICDRQYIASLATFLAAAAAALAALTLLVLWLVWVGLAMLALIVGGSLLWFYWGPRSDRPNAPRTRSSNGTRHA